MPVAILPAVSLRFLSTIAATNSAATDARLNRDAIILSVAIILLLMAVIVILIWRLSRKRDAFLNRQRSPYQPGHQTIADAEITTDQPLEE